MRTAHGILSWLCARACSYLCGQRIPPLPSSLPLVAVGRVSPELIAPRTPAAINLIKSENVPRPTMKLNGRVRVFELSAGNERKRVGPMPSLEILLSRFGRIVASAFQIFPSSLFPLFSIWILSFFLISTRAFNVILVGSFRFLSIRE